MEGTTTATTTTIIQTTSASAAVHLVLTVSGASVNVTEVKKTSSEKDIREKITRQSAPMSLGRTNIIF